MSKYYDTTSVMQVIGSIFKNPNLLDMEDKYRFSEQDFDEEFHTILFGAIYNLHHLGAGVINLSTIEDYLQQRPKKFGIYTANKGSEYLQQLVENTQLAAFDYYYARLKKMTLFRAYEKIGFNLKWLYDTDNILDSKKKQTQEEWLDNHSLEEIANIIDQKIDNIKLECLNNTDENFFSAGDGAVSLIEQLEQDPEFGYPLYGSLINTIHRGARLKKFYLRSAATGMGKTRAMIADCCYIGCNRIFDLEKQEWIDTGLQEAVLFIATEQDKSEVQTMMLAFISGVNEEHILMGKYEPNERERVMEAAIILQKSPIHIKELPDFSLQDVENTVKYGIREFDCHFIFFDYIHSSMKILSEIGNRSGVKGLREDNILFLMSSKLKDICNEYEVFILTSTQLNGEYQHANVYDQNLLRGAKAIADIIKKKKKKKTVSQEDKEGLRSIVEQMGVETPNLKMSVYKNRRGRYKDILLWCKADLGTCRIQPLFATDYNMELISINDTKISINSVQTSAF